MLRELLYTKQIEGENRRRWFTSAMMDLILWFDEKNQPVNFELCYDKLTEEKSLRWSAHGFCHTLIDSGEINPGRYKASPIHRTSGNFDIGEINQQFTQESAMLEEPVRQFVLNALAHIRN